MVGDSAKVANPTPTRKRIDDQKTKGKTTRFSRPSRPGTTKLHT